MKYMLLVITLAAAPAAARDFASDAPAVRDILAKTRALQSAEFTRTPDWFDDSRLKFDGLVKSGAGGIAILRYGWRDQYELGVFAFPGGPSISFKEHSANPMGAPKRSYSAKLETPAARKAAASLLRAAQRRQPVSGNDKAVLDDILAFLEGN